MNSLKNIVSVMCIVALIAAGCKKKQPHNEPEKPPSTPTVETEETGPELPPPPEVPAADRAAIADSVNAFSLELYRKVGLENTNLFFSPFSIVSALAMTSGGAKGETEQQMRKTLHFTLEGEQLHKAFAALSWKMQAKRNKLRVANRLWGQKGIKFLQSFLDLTNNYYGAQLEPVDFAGATEEARKTINAWVEKKTEGKIKDLIKQGMLSKITYLVLTNAVYFLGTWENKFEKKMTKEDAFILSDGSKVKVQMMHQAEWFNYASADGVQILEMPYVDNELSMVVLLPGQSVEEEKSGEEAIENLAELEEALTKENVSQWLTQLESKMVNVFLPKFTMTSEFLLSDALKSMGMELPFDQEKADFSGMADTDIFYLSRVIHKAFVDVDEEGTEAAAATAVMVEGAGPSKPVLFRADHPFIFIIKENGSGSFLFMGRVGNPAEGK